MKLLSMTEFVLQQNKNLKLAEEIIPQYKSIVKYAEFLKQPLTLGMFVPVDEEGNVLEEPKKFEGKFGDYQKILKKYVDAEEKVLFEGFEFSHDNNYNTVLKYSNESSVKVELQFRKVEGDVRLIINSDYIHDCSDVERLVGLKTKPELTESAIKQIGL